MKKIRRILSVLLAAVMMVSVLGGCNKSSSKETMFTVMEEAAGMTQCAYEMKVNLESDISGFNDMSLTLTGETDGKGITMGVKVKYLYLTLEMKDLITVTEDAMYVNVSQLLSAVENFVGESIDLEETIGMNIEWIELPFAEGAVSFEKDQDYEEYMNLVTSVLEAGLADAKMESKKGVYAAKIEGVENFAKFVENFLDALLDKEDQFIDYFTKNNSFDEDALKDTMNLYMNAIVSAAERFITDYDLGITEDELAQMRAEVEQEIEDELADLDVDVADLEDTYRELFDTIREEKDDYIDEIKGADNDDIDIKVEFSNELTGKAGSRVYTAEFLMEASSKEEDETINISMEMTMTEDTDIKVKAPKNYTSIEDLIYGALVYAYENGLIDKDMIYPGIEAVDPGVEPETETQVDPVIVNPVGEGFATFDDCVVIEYNPSVLIRTDDNGSDGTYADFTLANNGMAELSMIYAYGYDVQGAIDSILSSMDTAEGEQLVSYTEGGYLYEIYRYDVSYMGDTAEVYFYTITMSDINTIMISYAFGDELEAAGIDPEDFIEDLYVSVIADGGSGSVGGGSASGNDTYDGSVELTGYSDNVTVNYNKDLVYVDVDYSSPEYGYVCFTAVKDEYCYLFVGYDSTMTASDYYDTEVENYSDTDYYQSCDVTEITTRKVNGLEVQEFAISYTRDGDDSSYQNNYFLVEVPDGGILYGDYSDYDFDSSSVLSYEEMLEAIFQSVE